MPDKECLFVWRGADDEYERWSKAIKISLQEEDAIQAIQEDLSGGDADQKKKNDEAMFILMMHTESITFNTIIRESSARDMWMKLESRFKTTQHDEKKKSNEDQHR